MKTTLPEKIETIEVAKTFLAELMKNNEAFHPHDDAHQIMWETSPRPTKEDCKKLNTLMSQINDLPDFDPCEYLLSFEGILAKNLIEEKLIAIRKVAIDMGLAGKLSFQISDVSISGFNEGLELTTRFTRNGNCFEVTEDLTVEVIYSPF